LFDVLATGPGDHRLADAEAQDALFQAAVRVVMRLVVCLFAEARQLLPVLDPVYARSYGVRTLYELLEEAVRDEGGAALLHRQGAWPRLMGLFRMIHNGSPHGQFPLRSYGGALFRPGDAANPDGVVRALHLLEHRVSVSDATVHQVLRKLLRGPLPVMRGRQKSFVEGPVDYTDLRTEFIGLIYEGLLDYRLQRSDAKTGPLLFLNLGREPVLPLARLEAMLADDKPGLKNLLTTLRKEKATATVEAEEDEDAEEEDAPAEEEDGDGADAEIAVEEPTPVVAEERSADYLDAAGRARAWACEAVKLAGLVAKKTRRQSDADYQRQTEAEADKLIRRVVATGEFYLVRAGNVRKGTGTFYTRPQLAVPTTHRTLEPLCYDRPDGAPRVPKTPEAILALKVCDPACGSASFLVAALHYITDAVYESLRQHRNLEDAATARKLTLPLGRSKVDDPEGEPLPFYPDDPKFGHLFPERVKARLRRFVVERCIYGVDMNPLAVELGRVSLWVETLDPELPFSFLDHKLKVGNALVGCWLDRVLDYPIAAWERNGGDDPDSKTAGARTERIQTLLSGPRGANRRRPTEGGLIKKEMRQVIDTKFSQTPSLFGQDAAAMEQVVAAARKQYEQMHRLPISETERQEAEYHRRFRDNPLVLRLKRAMDEWCAVWFWPMEEDAARHAPTPVTFHAVQAGRDRILDALVHDLRFFHWELEFPDVFTPERAGFDAVLGNPPWEVMKPNSHEFFTAYDPLYRTYDKQAALARQRELFADDPATRTRWDDYNATFKALSNWVKNAAEPFAVSLALGGRGEELKGAWERARKDRVGYANREQPYRYQGSADLNSYKLFLEVSLHLVRAGGRLGIILPSGLYTDDGCRELRAFLLNRTRWDWLFGFINWELIFNIYYRFKFVIAIIQRESPASNHEIRSCFGRYSISDWEEADRFAFPLPKATIVDFSPKSLSILEIANQRDLEICRQIYDCSIRIGDNAPGWEVTYAREFDMTNDSKHFPPRQKWEARDFRPDVFGRWIGPGNEVALPLYEGRMIGQFDFSQKGWVSGKGRSAVWRELTFDCKTLEPQFLLSESTHLGWEKRVPGVRLGFMSIGSSTNARTGIGCVLNELPCGNSVSVLSIDHGNLAKTLYLAGATCSLAFDFAFRARVGGINLNWFIIEEAAFPKFPEDERSRRLILSVASLTFIHRRFAPEWLRLRYLHPELATREWKNWWAVTEADRLRLRVEIDALVAHLYGLTPDDFDWVVRDDPTDTKGFWRVEKHLPFRERLTGLAAAAFRALKAGRWDAARAVAMSNDEFFAAIGIPEMTNPEAAAKADASVCPEGKPLILKRDGCHRWHPEEFGTDDPRHGWTWDHCRQDAIALLGSEDAVRKYVEGEQEQEEPAEAGDAPTDLSGDPLPPKGRLF
jgi:hypothetical protein